MLSDVPNILEMLLMLNDGDIWQKSLHTASYDSVNPHGSQSDLIKA